MLCLALSLLLFTDPLIGAGRIMVSLAASLDQPSVTVRIVQPADSSIVGDGNLILIEGTVTSNDDGVVDRVEVAFDGDEFWSAALRSPDDPSQWSYVWADPSAGSHRIRVRAGEGQRQVEQAITVQVADLWTTPFTVDNPYAGAGVFRRGELHDHSTNSFDGWTSLSPQQLAQEYQRLGYQFMAITDHDVISYPTEIEDGRFVVIPAYESTSESGHITALWVDQVASPELPPQPRIDHITAQGGMAILNHPGWRIGWTASDFRTLQGYFGFEIWNQVTGTDLRAERNVRLWHDVLNAKGWPNQIWAIAVEDRHDIESLRLGWVEVKSAELTAPAIRRALEKGAFYASNGPQFSVLGMAKGAIMASSPDASTIRFIDQDLRTVAEGPGSGAAYRLQGTERWVRVEAVTPDGRTAWSQPFWLLPNTPRVSFVPTPDGPTLVGETLPRSRVHVSENGRYLGNVVASEAGAFVYRLRDLPAGAHNLWVMVTSSWPDQVESPPALLTINTPSG